MEHIPLHIKRWGDNWNIAIFWCSVTSAPKRDGGKILFIADIHICLFFSVDCFYCLYTNYMTECSMRYIPSFPNPFLHPNNWSATFEPLLEPCLTTLWCMQQSPFYLSSWKRSILLPYRIIWFKIAKKSDTKLQYSNTAGLADIWYVGMIALCLTNNQKKISDK